jgi:alcohol oxidase
VAGRVAAADPSLLVLVVEGGMNNHNREDVLTPAFCIDHLLPTSLTANHFIPNKSAATANRVIDVAAGGLLGGGSSINIMQYVRASRLDFDSWKMPGWSTDEIIPYLKRLETYHGRGEKAVHGYSGPVQICRDNYFNGKTSEDFVQACKQVGVTEYADMQDLETGVGVERMSATVDLKGRRQDSAHCYLHPLLSGGKHPNLHVLCEHNVKRVLLEGERASGVDIVPNSKFLPEKSKITHTIRARKLVVVSSGAFGTPAILERSGIGAKDILDRAGIPQQIDLPGVGWGYQDHNMTMLPFRTNLEELETFSWLLIRPDLREKARLNKDPVLGWNACDVSLKMRPTEAEVDDLGPAFREAWNREFRDIPNRPLMLMSFVSATLDPRAFAEGGQYISVTTYPCYPWGRGHVHVTGADPDDTLDFNAGIFEGPGGEIDLKVQVWAYKKAREIMRRTRMFRGEFGPGHPAFAEDSPARSTDLRGEEKSLTEQGAVENIKYSKEDDAAIEKHLREIIGTAWHALGTARMAPRDQHGVVDQDLNVYGVKGLKVADLSMVPANVCANTCNTAMVIGEKAASIIISELGLKDDMNGVDS